jgi:hypothetical protein
MNACCNDAGASAANTFWQAGEKTTLRSRSDVGGSSASSTSQFAEPAKYAPWKPSRLLASWMTQSLAALFALRTRIHLNEIVSHA